MATDAATYPKISKKSWFLVRDRLKQSIPNAITPTIITSLAPMAEASARSNVINPLRDLGLIDSNGKPTELAQRWRHDDDYTAVCHEIRNNIYPLDLIEAFPDGDSSKRALIKKWFMKAGNVGSVAAEMYSGTYILLSHADLTRPEEKATAKAAPRKSPPQARIVKPAPAVEHAQASAVSTHQPPPEQSGHRRLPAIHIDVQVHISPDTSPEQIDRIFESMGKHLGSHIK